MGRLFRFSRCSNCIRLRRATADQSLDCFSCKKYEPVKPTWWESLVEYVRKGARVVCGMLAYLAWKLLTKIAS